MPGGREIIMITIKENMKLYTELLKTLFKSKLEYRFNFFMEIFINIFTYAVTYTGIWVLTKSFENIAGWGFYELMLLYNFNLFSYGLACSVLYIPMQALEEMVRMGDFDGVLVKPMNPFLYLLMRQGYFGFIGHMLLGLIIFIISLSHLHLEITLGFILNTILKLIGATLLQGAVLIFSGALSFRFVRALAVRNVFIYHIREFIDYPISIYPKLLQIFLTVIVPYGFVNFYPVEALLSQYSETSRGALAQAGILPLWLADNAGLFLGILSVFLGYRFFMASVKKYQSTGS